MRKEIDVYDYAEHILRQLKKGILITTSVGDKVNSMTISWGQLGIEWGRLIFTTFVRTGRYTHRMLEEKGEFTVNIPMETRAGKIIAFCGTKSGKDFDKVKELGMTLIKGDKVDVPGIKELPLTLECKIIYTQLQDKEAIPAEFIPDFYPQDVDGDFHGANKDFHTVFMGEVVGAYILEK